MINFVNIALAAAHTNAVVKTHTELRQLEEDAFLRGFKEGVKFERETARHDIRVPSGATAVKNIKNLFNRN